jgi:colanic acid/amylovoran biosynthesis glycosyltransferase
MKIAYLTNRYPEVSHSFIRREIVAVEAAGATVERWSVRRPHGDLPDPRDQAELARTHFILEAGVPALIWAWLRLLLRHPIKSFRALRLALKMAEPSPTSLVRHCAYLFEACYLVGAFARQGIEHVHAHFGTNPTTVAGLAQILGGPPYSFTVHGPDEFDRPVALDLAGKIADAKLAVAISSFGRSQLMRWSHPDHWHKIAIARCGVDDVFLSDNLDTPAIPEAPRLACVARLSAQKGLPLLIEAAARLHDEGVDFHLTLVGDGELRPQIEASIAKAGLSDKISITGWCNGDAVRTHILAARAMVLPSFAEGLPVVIMEALALRRPVIVTAIAGTPELVDGGCGWLIPAGSVEALVDAMKAAVSATPETLAKMGAEGRERVKASHDATRNGADLLSLISDSAGA